MNLEHINKQLNKWKGADASIHEYTHSHEKLTLYLKMEGKKECIRLVMAPVSYIKGPTSWNNASIRVTFDDGIKIEERCQVADEQVGFLVKCAGADIFFN